MNKAIDSKLYNLKKYGVLDHFVWDKIFFKKTKEILGGSVEIICCGAAPIEPKVVEFLKICFNSPIVIGYG